MDRLNPEKAFTSSMKIVPRMECPVCHTSSHAVRNGHKHGEQAFLYRACGKSFVTTSNTLLSGSHYSSDVWKTVLTDTLMGVSLDDTRDRLDLQHIRNSYTSLFFMRGISHSQAQDRCRHPHDSASGFRPGCAGYPSGRGKIERKQ